MNIKKVYEMVQKQAERDFDKMEKKVKKLISKITFLEDKNNKLRFTESERKIFKKNDYTIH